MNTTSLLTRSLPLALLCSPLVALAQEPAAAPPAAADAPPAEPAPEPAEDPEAASARAFITETVGFIQKGKFKEYKARLHPVAVKSVEERNKKTKRDDHNLAFWTHVKEWKMQTWEVTGITPGPRATMVVAVKEDRFLIEEKGVDEGKEAEWLLLKNVDGGKGKPAWFILDRKNGGTNFPDSVVEKAFGDVLPPGLMPVGEAPDAAKAKLSPQDAYSARVETAIRSKFKLPEGIPEPQQKVMKGVVKVMLDENGAVLSRTVSKASGNPDFDRAIIRAVDAAQPFPAPEGPVEEAARKGLDITFKAIP